ncbi:MAG: YdcH family protein [Candidatus Competibacterales bacterium]|nr:YdcH family protein [Candidatus Competibacterales bacterium]
MLGEKHDLIHELPEYRDLIHQLRADDPQFAQWLNEYHELDHQVRRGEAGVEPHADPYMENLKKQRLLLKDRLYARLREAEQNRA